MKHLLGTLLLALTSLFLPIQVVGAPIVYDNRVDFENAQIGAVMVEDFGDTFQTDFDPIFLVPSNPGFPPFADEGQLHIETDGNLFHANSIFAFEPFQSFGIEFRNVQPGIFLNSIPKRRKWRRKLICPV